MLFTLQKFFQLCIYLLQAITLQGLYYPAKQRRIALCWFNSIEYIIQYLGLSLLSWKPAVCKRKGLLMKMSQDNVIHLIGMQSAQHVSAPNHYIVLTVLCR